jgi:hypothetical protein
MYTGKVIRDNIQVDGSLQLPPQGEPLYVDSQFSLSGKRVVADMEEMADVLPL